MSWNYSGNPNSSPKDELRFIVGDTNANEPIMQDEEFQYLIDTYGTNRASLLYQAFSRVATLFARDIKRALGPQSEDPTERLKFYKDQAEFYRRQTTSAGLSVPTYQYPKTFRKGMQSNPPWPGGDDSLV